MTGYFDSIRLFSWHMDKKKEVQYEKHVNKLDLNVMLGIWLFLQFISFCYFSYFNFKSLVSGGFYNESFVTYFSYQIFYLLISIIIIGLFFVGGFHFTKLFFRSNFTLKDFLKYHIYFNLPFTLISLFNLVLLFLIISFNVFLGLIFFLPLSLVYLYFVLKGLNTLLYIFKTKFGSKSEWELVGIVILWSLLFSVIGFFLFLFITLFGILLFI